MHVVVANQTVPTKVEAVVVVDPATGAPASPLRAFSTAFNQAVTTTNASVALPADSTAVHLSVVGCHARIRFGAGAQTAVTTDVRILDGVPYDLAIPAGTTHLGIIAESGAGVLSGCKLV